MTLEEFKKQCIDEYKKQIENKERWELLCIKQKTFGKSYIPNKFLKHLFSLSCPNCNKKLEKVKIYYKEGFDHVIYKCECGYEWAAKRRST